MKSAVLVLSLALCGSAMGLLRTEKAKAWNLWTRQYGKTYSDIEGFYRYQVFAKNMEMIAAHNAKNAGFTMAANEFADLTPEEFNARFVGGFRSQPRRGNFNLDLLRTSSVDLPSSVDWSKKGAVTPIKNQGQCGSCWAFSTTGSVEGITFIKTGQLISLSEQQLVDCSGSFGNQGCNGGLMDNAFEYIVSNGGICSEASYPYHASDGTCQSSSCKSVATISGHVDVPHYSDNALMTAVVQQPVSVAIQANQGSFQFYSGGVMTASCGHELDHGVLVVGYGSDNGQDYYKVKNSWGASWGMSGYILLGRGSDFGTYGQCGILSDPSYPTKN